MREEARSILEVKTDCKEQMVLKSRKPGEQKSDSKEKWSAGTATVTHCSSYALQQSVDGCDIW